MNVLVVAPHPDDESIGCGGSLRQHALRGDRICIAFLTSGELGLKDLPSAEARAMREREARAAAEVLGARRLEFFRRPDWGLSDCVAATTGDLATLLEEERPHTIYFPHDGESHPDHQAVSAATLAAVRAARRPPAVYMAYEVWSPLPAPNWVADITPVFRDKLRALRCHRSQLVEFRYDRAVRGLNQYRGVMSLRCRYGEAFMRSDAGAAGEGGADA